jgi:hypothetical protein
MLAAGAIPSGFRLYAANSDFWNKKDPANWSSDEIDKLVTKSPWAKQVNASSPAMSRGYGDNGGSGGGGMGDPGIGGTGGGYPGGGGGYPGGGMGGGGRGMGGGGRRGGAGQMPISYTATVRWESAKPVQEALKTPLPEGLAGAYVISVSGVPVLQPGRQHSDDGDSDTTVSKGLSDEVLDRIKNLTYLEPKGKSAAQPSVVQKGAISSSGRPTLLFGFPRDVVPLTADDKEVAFTTKLGGVEVKTKFNLKDMMYRNELAL